VGVPVASDTTTQAKVGQTLGRPVVVKLPSGSYAVLVTSGYNSTADGKGRLWMLNPATGAVMHEFTRRRHAGGRVGPGPCQPLRRDRRLRAYVYGGDLLGNVWRFDLVARTARPRWRC
jgi:type IV pilus assembly protein PilY1